MSAAQTNYGVFGLVGLRMSADEFLALGEVDGRFELVDGVVVMAPSARPLHWRVQNEVNKQLLAFQTCGGECHHYCDIDVRFSDSTVFRPDVAVYAGLEPVPIPYDLLRVPDLAIEVLSKGSKALDLVTKRQDYERFGVGEYWVIDPDDASVRGWRRGDGGFEALPARPDGIESTAIPGFRLDMTPIRRLTTPT